jgi:futalosine hydrolase
VSGVRAPDGPLLVLAASEGELAELRRALAQAEPAGLRGWPDAWRGRLEGRPALLAATGVGKAAAAAAAAAFALRERPCACLLTGIAGAYVGAFVPVGAVACASEEIDLDAGVADAGGVAPLHEPQVARARAAEGGGPLYERIATDPAWTERLQAACGLVAQPFATSDAVAGDLDVAAARAARSGAAVESMEGAAVALACARLGLPFAEVRGVSNVAGVRDKTAWQVGPALAAAGRALRRAVATAP